MRDVLSLWILAAAVLTGGCGPTERSPVGVDEKAPPRTHVVAHRYVEEVPQVVTGSELSAAFKAGTPWRTLAERSWKVRLAQITRSARWLPHGEVWNQPLWPEAESESRGGRPPGGVERIDIGGVCAAPVVGRE
ncbi:MAG: hypothetical protein AAGM22_31060 [Acidobacteriota bacterium]